MPVQAHTFTFFQGTKEKLRIFVRRPDSTRRRKHGAFLVSVREGENGENSLVANRRCQAKRAGKRVPAGCKVLRTTNFDYLIFWYSALASLNKGRPGSASFIMAKKSW